MNLLFVYCFITSLLTNRWLQRAQHWSGCRRHTFKWVSESFWGSKLFCNQADATSASGFVIHSIASFENSCQQTWSLFVFKPLKPISFYFKHVLWSILSFIVEIRIVLLKHMMLFSYYEQDTKFHVCDWG